MSKPTPSGYRARHGYKGTPTYKSWDKMMVRCFNPRNVGFKYYKGAGITVCERWRIFTNFLADMGERPTVLHSLDRFPNHAGNYEPGNVRWATSVQQNNNRSTNRFFTMN